MSSAQTTQNKANSARTSGAPYKPMKVSLTRPVKAKNTANDYYVTITKA